MEGAGGEPPPQRTRSRQELLRERRRGGGGDGGSAGGSSPPSSRHGEGSASPSGSPLTHDEEAKETASRIHSLLERSCSSDAQRQRVFAAAVERARSPQRSSSGSPQGSRLTLPGGRTARVEPPSHVLAQAERAARSPHLPDSVLAPRLAGLEEEVVSLHQKIDVLKEQLQAGMQTALECSAQVVRLAPPLLPRPRAAL